MDTSSTGRGSGPQEDDCGCGDVNNMKYFAKVPVDFLKGVRLVPHNFDDPENSLHGDYVAKQLRQDLFSTAYMKIYMVEERRLAEGEWYKLKSIEKTDCDADTWLNKFLARQYVSAGNDDFISCEKWTILQKNGSTSEYQMKFLQSVNDHFYSLALPDGLPKKIRLWWSYGGF
jgi:hypothetical protein